jgi:hypothetical protein
MFKFPGVQLLSSLLEQTSGKTVIEKTIVLEVHETYFEQVKKRKGDEDADPI